MPFQAADVLLETRALFFELNDFLLRKLVVRAVLAHALEGAEPIEAALDGAKVRERATEPAVGDEEHAGAPCFFLHDLLRLALGAHEEHRATARNRVGDEVERALEESRRLIEVDDVDAAARAVDVRAHLRVPALRLVAEMDAGFEERANTERLARVAQGAFHFTGIGDLGRRFWDCGIGDAGRRFIHWCAFSFRLILRPAAGKPEIIVSSTEPDGRASGRVVYSPRTSPRGRGIYGKSTNQ